MCFKTVTIIVTLGALVAGVYMYYTKGQVGQWVGSGAQAMSQEEVTTPTQQSTATLETVPATKFVSKWNDLKEEGAKLIDVRTEGEYVSGHYEMAEMIDFYGSDFTSKLEALDKDTQYFIYCRSGSRSGQTLRLMQGLGFKKVYDLAGGIGGNGPILPIVAI